MPGLRRAVASSLFAQGFVAIVASATASAQYVPIRELDSNGLLAGETPFHLSGEFVAGIGTKPWTPAYWDASGTHVLPFLPGLDFGWATSCNESGEIVGYEWDSFTWSG